MNPEQLGDITLINILNNDSGRRDSLSFVA